MLSSSGLTVRCFTVPSPILQSLRTTFYTYPDRPRLLSAAISPEPVGEPVPATCIRDKDRRVLRVFTDQGQQFNVALQFPVRNCWSSKFGLLVERQVTEELEDLSSNKSVLFSLLHPLDDFTRVVMKQSNRISEFQVRHSSV